MKDMKGKRAHLLPEEEHVAHQRVMTETKRALMAAAEL